MSNFVHLHNHTQYSLLDGAVKIEDLIAEAKNLGMKALAITDHGNMFGAIEFYKKAIDAGIKPIIGIEVYVSEKSIKEDPRKTKKSTYYHLILLAKNLKGYKNLIQLSTISFLEGFYRKPRIDDDLLKQYAEGIIGLSACVKGEIPTLILKGKYNKAKEKALFYKEIFNGDFFIEVQDHGLEEELKVKEEIIKLGKEIDTLVVATNDTHYLKKEHHKAHDIVICINTGKTLEDENRLKFHTNQLYFKSENEMRKLFPDNPEVIDNTVKIANKCNLILEFGKLHLPKYPIPDSAGVDSLEEYLKKVAYEGLKKRYSKITPELEDRLLYELNIINKMRYAGYFLIVKDFVDFAKSESIPVGPGRGSAAGSLVSYCLGITNIDPIKYNLLFERFLNPERVSMPDIDIDFSDDRRDEIIQYVKKKYGQNNVTQIITFGSMNARAVVRDVGRVLNIPLSEVDRIAKMIPPGKSLNEAIESVPELKEIIDSNSKYKELIEHSKVLEGLSRHASIHAAGVVISPTKLTDYLPLYKNPQKGEITTQYSMKYIEEIGLLKMDFLGLRTLTVIDNTLKLLKKRGINIDLDNLPQKDKKTFKLFSRGETTSIFQFESRGMKDYLRKLKPEYLEDLIAMNALYRPGPLGSNMVDDFIRRKHGETEITYPHKKLKPVLEETYGVIVYQEQVMQIASTLGGFSLGNADILRRAMGKKISSIMHEQRNEFIKGAEKKGIEKKLAEDIFDLMEKFAQYGFNKSHSTGYAVIAYQTGYLKANYPVEFMASTLSSELDNTDKIKIFTEECFHKDIEIIPPDVNKCFYEFVPDGNSILYGLGAIKGIGKGAVESIVKAREEHGKFKNIYELCKNIDLKLINKKVLESLIKSGALDSLKGNRAQKLAVIESALSYGQNYQHDINSGQTSIFAAGDKKVQEEESYPTLPEIEEIPQYELLNYEKEVFGFYLSGHPLSEYGSILKSLASSTFTEIKNSPTGVNHKAFGIITKVKEITDKNNNPMAFVTISDFNDSIEILVFSGEYKKYKKYIKPDKVVASSLKVNRGDNNGTRIILQNIMPIEKGIENLTKKVYISLNTVGMEKSFPEKIKEILLKYSGTKEVFFEISNLSDDYILIKSKDIKVKPTKGMITSLEKILGKGTVRLRI